MFRVILCLDSILWYIKTLHTYTVVKTIGPKLIMIGKMTLELLSFMVIILLVMFGFGICMQALMYHNAKLDANLLSNVFFPAYFVIGGQYTRNTIMTGTRFRKIKCEIKMILYLFEYFKLKFAMHHPPTLLF